MSEKKEVVEMIESTTEKLGGQMERAKLAQTGKMGETKTKGQVAILRSDPIGVQRKDVQLRLGIIEAGADLALTETFPTRLIPATW